MVAAAHPSDSDDAEALVGEPVAAPADVDVDEEAGRQRRENVRVDVQLPLMIRMHGREVRARTRDVSATGVGFATRLPVELDEQCDVDIEFDGWTFTKRIVIKFIKPILAGSIVGAQFDSLSEGERERLVKQVFDVQRAQLRSE